MATSAFKSTSRRGNSDTPKKAKAMRRSQSVSAITKGTAQQSNVVVSEFLKRDNPLFCSSASPTPEEFPDAVAGCRGRRRSVSRPRFAPSQSEAELESTTPSSSRIKNVNICANRRKKGIVSENMSDFHETTMVKKFTELSIDSASYSEGPWEDALSSGSLTEAEEKTIQVFYEQIKGDHVDGVVSPSNGIYETVRSEVRRAILDIQNDLGSAIQGNNTHAMAATNVAEILPDLVNPGAVELVSDIRNQYAKKLKESQERAAKLRVDLAVEERRGQEFSRILKEIIPDPKTKNVQISRPGRKRSNERKNMSKRLTEEAMSYFDECVSISTFDSSDFSTAEDPPFLLVEASTQLGPDASFMPDGSNIPTSYCANSSHNRNQDPSHSLFMNSHRDSDLTVSSGSNEPVINKKSRFSFSQKPTENGGLQHDIRSYIKNIDKDFAETTINSENSRANYNDMDQYVRADGEKLLLEMVLSKNRMEFGGLHLCGGGLAISFPPFASLM